MSEWSKYAEYYNNNMNFNTCNLHVNSIATNSKYEYKISFSL